MIIKYILSCIFLYLYTSVIVSIVTKFWLIIKDRRYFVYTRYYAVPWGFLVVFYRALQVMVILSSGWGARW